MNLITKILFIILVNVLVLGCTPSPVDEQPSIAVENTTVEAEVQVPPVVEDVVSPPSEEPNVETIPSEPKTRTYTINLIDGGFDIKEVTIKAGDAVEWKNKRLQGSRYPQGLIIGTLRCANVKSHIFQPGDSFLWTFTQPMTCTIVDGIFTT